MRAVGGHLRRNAVAYVAIFLALTAGAYAVTKAPKNSVVSKSIRNGQVKAPDIAGGAVGSGAIDNGSVKSEDLGENVVGVEQLKQGAVTGVDGVVSSPPTFIDDPQDGAPGTARTLVQSGPFTFEGVCVDAGGGNVNYSGRITSSVPAYALEGEGADLLVPNVAQGVAGTNSVTDVDNARSGPSIYVVALDGRFLSVGTQVVVHPTTGTGDCLFHAAGIAG
jgi:hypothetical protein